MTRLFAPSHEAKPGAPLAPILGQQQIKVQDFIAQFNLATVDYQPGIPLPCRITKTGMKFTLKVQPPTTWCLLYGLARHRRVRPSVVYDICRFQLRLEPLTVREVVGSFRSGRFRIG